MDLLLGPSDSLQSGGIPMAIVVWQATSLAETWPYEQLILVIQCFNQMDLEESGPKRFPFHGCKIVSAAGLLPIWKQQAIQSFAFHGKIGGQIAWEKIYLST